MFAAELHPNSMEQICDFGLARIVTPSTTNSTDDVVEPSLDKEKNDPEAKSLPPGMASPPVSHGVM